MKIFNVEKTEEIVNPNLELGHLELDKRLVRHHEETQEIIIKTAKEIAEAFMFVGMPVEKVREEYFLVKGRNADGSKILDPIKPVVEPAQGAWDEYELIQIYVPYTEQELAKIQIETLKKKLSETDYQAIKYAEGLLSPKEYEPIKTQRQSWRDEINALELTLASEEDKPV